MTFKRASVFLLIALCVTYSVCPGAAAAENIRTTGADTTVKITDPPSSDPLTALESVLTSLELIDEPTENAKNTEVEEHQEDVKSEEVYFTYKLLTLLRAIALASSGGNVPTVPTTPAVPTSNPTVSTPAVPSTTTTTTTTTTV